MLQFIIGTAGTGKTYEISKKIKELINKKEKVLLIVPEQYSFISERRLYKEIGAKNSLYLEVLSLTRLCDNIFRKFGGKTGLSISDTAKYLIMAIAVQQLSDKLQVYKKSSTNTAFLQTLIEACSEFKSAGITPDKLVEIEYDINDVNLSLKLNDLSMLYQAYQAIIDNGFSDPEDNIIKAVEILENNNFFEEYNVFIDGFTTFMSGEFEFLRHIIAQSKSVTLTLTTDVIDNNTDDGIFAVVKQAAKRLIKYAQDQDVPVLEKIVLSGYSKYDNKYLEKISKEYMNPQAVPCIDNVHQVELLAASNYYEELTYVAANIVKNVREDNIRYNEIAVIARDPEPISEVIKLVFSKYDIPFFMDERIDISSSPIVMGTLAALDCIKNNFSLQSVVSFLKSPIVGKTVEEASILENYAYIWQVRGQLWWSDFLNNPRGMAEDFTDQDKVLLEEVNQTRKDIISPLLELKDNLNNDTGIGFATALYNFLLSINANENLDTYARSLPEEDYNNFIDLNAKIWDALIDILDIFAKIISSSKLARNKLIELFSLAVKSTDIGVLPQSLDQVLVGGADRIRPGDIKVAFVIGANEGVFPKSVSNTGIFSQSEKKILNDSGIEIGGTNLYQSLLENYYSYFAVTMPSEKLFLSYSNLNNKGEQLFESVIVNEIKRLVPNLKENYKNNLEIIQNEASAVSVLSDNFTSDTVLRASLYKFLKQNNPILVDKFKHAAYKPEHKLNNKEYISEMFGAKMYLSASKIERFYKCNFAFFANDGLKIRKREKVDFSPLESGSIIHYIMQVMLQSHGGKGLGGIPREVLSDEIGSIINSYLAQRLPDENAISIRMKHLFNRLRDTMVRLIEHIGSEFLQSQYEPVEFELEIKESKKIKPLNLITPDGVEVVVEGIVDRVDIMKKNGRKYVRVVDYKSGRKDFKLEDVLYGLNLQMLLYLFTISENGEEELKDAIPSGVLYMPVREGYSSLERTTSESEAKKKLAESWKMSGILLDDEEVLRGMEEDLAGVFIPVQLNKDGTLSKKSQIASIAEMGSLANEVKEQIKNMAVALTKGSINNIPVDHTDYPTCQYCEYKSVCGYEEGDPVKTIERISKQELFEILKERDEENA